MPLFSEESWLFKNQLSFQLYFPFSFLQFFEIAESSLASILLAIFYLASQPFCTKNEQMLGKGKAVRQCWAPFWLAFLCYCLHKSLLPQQHFIICHFQLLSVVVLICCKSFHHGRKHICVFSLKEIQSYLIYFSGIGFLHLIFLGVFL